MKRSRQTLCDGFTLLELLVVMGLMILMAGGLGLALRDGSPGMALEAGQAAVARLLEVARAQATLNRERALLVVCADPGSERFLRRLAVVIETGPDSGRWTPTGDEAILPPGIFVVPPAGSVRGAAFGETGTAGNRWPATRQSSVQAAPDGSIGPEPNDPGATYLSMVTPLSAAGLAIGGGGGRLVLAGGRRMSSGVLFDRPDQVRGVVLSAYGVAILVDDGAGLDF